jgi:hypothetical protein
VTSPARRPDPPHPNQPASNPPATPPQVSTPPTTTIPAPPRLVVYRLHHASVVLDVPINAPPGPVIHAATFWPEP